MALITSECAPFRGAEFARQVLMVLMELPHGSTAVGGDGARQGVEASQRMIWIAETASGESIGCVGVLGGGKAWRVGRERPGGGEGGGAQNAPGRAAVAELRRLVVVPAWRRKGIGTLPARCTLHPPKQQ